MAHYIKHTILLLTGFLLALSGKAQKKIVTAHKTNSSIRIQSQPFSVQRLHFCGEIVPMEQANVSAKLASALAGSSNYTSHLRGLKARSAPFFAVIEPILARNNIPGDFKYLPLIESAWQANAVSSAGAIGYWQFMDETARDMGLSITSGNDERTDLRKSTEAACKYLKFLYRKLGSWTLVAAAYNGGVGMVQRKISHVGHRDYYSMTMNPETGYYLYRILAMKELFTNPLYGRGIPGLLLASSGDEYERERQQARRMGWLHDEDPEPVGMPVEALQEEVLTNRTEVVVMDSVLTELLKQQPATTVFTGDVSARLVKAGQLKIGQSWAFVLTDSLQVGEDELKAGDVLYALVDDIDQQGNLFLRATKAVSSATNETIPLSLLALNPATGLAGIPHPKSIKPGWVVQWKLIG
jgi:hypothetical protein